MYLSNISGIIISFYIIILSLKDSEVFFNSLALASTEAVTSLPDNIRASSYMLSSLSTLDI